jgi:Fe-S-cluster-containing dehydrogenase component
MTVSRRHALKVLGAAACAAAVVPAMAEARAAKVSGPDDIGLLFDATRCIGCRACVTKCREANNTQPNVAVMNGGVYDAPLDLNGTTLTVIKQWDADGKSGYVKAHCMHCADPACVSVCMMGALHKEPRGVVAYDVSMCVGCRYCQVACPFNVPRFQWESATPRIAKCELCRQRPGGKGPACAEVCPRGAVITGKRTELLAEAKRRLAETPSAYRGGVYGETEAGGTNCLYLSPVGFEPLGLPRLGVDPVPALSETIQHGIYQGFIAPVALFGAFAFVAWKNHRSAEAGEEDHR